MPDVERDVEMDAGGDEIVKGGGKEDLLAARATTRVVVTDHNTRLETPVTASCREAPTPLRSCLLRLSPVLLESVSGSLSTLLVSFGDPAWTISGH